MKKRLLGLLCVLALCLGLLPATVFAAGGDKAIMLGTSGISGYDADTGYDYIYFGDWTTPDSNVTPGPIKWRVLDDQTNTGEEGLFLLSEGLLGTGRSGNVYFHKSYHTNDDADNTVIYYYKGDAHDGDHENCQFLNVWQGSDAQAWCKDFVGSDGDTILLNCLPQF